MVKIFSNCLLSKNIVFDGVRVIGAVDHDHDRYLRCEGVESGLALGDTYPIPPCFQDKTDKREKMLLDYSN